MRLHRLSLGGVGPFASSYDLDLDRVAAGGLFLLEGPTGAGKSTVLDAITFALYGSVAGRTGHKDRLHTDFATAVEPFVELELSVGGVRHRIRRTPAWRRPKRDGSGTTPVQATVRLWRVTRTGEELVSQRVREADDEIRDLLGGLSRDQFCQVVLLPQGEFATFLRADAEERRDVLQRLFATDHYQAVEKALVEMRQTAVRQVERADTVVRDALAALVEASGDLDLDVDALLASSDDARRVRLDLAEDVLRDAADRAEVEERAAAAVRDAAEAAHAAVVERARLAATRRDADTRAEALAGRDAAVAQTARSLEAATRAAGVGSLVGAVAAAEEQLRSRVADLAEVAPAVDPDHLPDDLAESAAQVHATLATLQPWAARESSLVGRRRELQAAVDSLAALTTRRQQLVAQLSVLPAELEAVRAELAEATTTAASLEDVTTAWAVARERLVQWAAVPVAESSLAAAEAAHSAAVDLAQQAREHVLELTERRLRGMAAELAAGLADHEPCPVCGSSEHPLPAVPDEQPVDREVLAQAETVAQRAQAARTASAERAATARAVLAATREAAGSADPTDDVAALAERERQAREARSRLPDLIAAVTGVEHDLASAREEAAGLDVERASLHERITASEAECAADDAALLEARGEHASVAVRLRALTSDAKALVATIAAVEAVREARAARDTARALAESAASSAGFASLSDATAALVDTEVLTAWEESVRDHERAWAVVRAALEEPGVRQSDGVAPDLEPTRVALAEADAARDAAHAVTVAARQRVSRVHGRREILDHVVAETAAVRAETRPVVRVADAASGASSVNPRRITLSTYVLRERFDSVVAAASRRLERMSDGRFVLERDESTSGNRKAGLGLAVLDQWTGVRRDTRTLSGGESFYASLALALGLADVVRDEAGGVELETLFIDEGFGSLDSEALESVLDVIDSLRDGGRVVGIVSHVTELKERVPDRIEVRRRVDGSSALAVRA